MSTGLGFGLCFTPFDVGFLKVWGLDALKDKGGTALREETR
jgi:hypothetical protein